MDAKNFIFILLLTTTFLIVGCSNSQVHDGQETKIQRLTALLSEKNYVQEYTVIFTEDSGKHVGYKNNFTLYVKDEKIIAFNSTMYESAGTAKPFDDICYITYDRINSLKKINCSILNNYDTYSSINITNEEQWLYDRYDSYISNIDDGNYTQLTATISDMKNMIASQMNYLIGHYNYSDSNITQSGECYLWNYSYAGHGYYKACFDGGLLVGYYVSSSSLGYTDDINWHIFQD